MPNRILRDWTDSFKFEGISPQAEVLFTRLIMKADDFGRYHAHPQLIKSGCFPLADDLRANTVAAWLTELSDRQLVFCYKRSNRALLAIVNFGQLIREDVKPKFDAPEGKPERWVPGESGGDSPPPAADRRDLPPPAAVGGVGVGVGDEGAGVGVGEVPAGPPPAANGAPAPERMSENQSVAVAMSAGIPDDFVRYVHQDWLSRAGKDAGGVLVEFLPYVTKRWSREQIEWKTKTHKGKKSPENVSRAGPDRNAGTYNAGTSIDGLKRKVR